MFFFFYKRRVCFSSRCGKMARLNVPLQQARIGVSVGLMTPYDLIE